jgi:hypothetical protein
MLILNKLSLITKKQIEMQQIIFFSHRFLSDYQEIIEMQLFFFLQTRLLTLQGTTDVDVLWLPVSQHRSLFN